MIACFKKHTTLFFAVNALACVGLNISVVGVNWFIIDATRRNSILGMYGAVSIISAFITLSLSGHITDKYPKMTVLKYCCIGQAVLFFGVGLAHALQMPVGWIIGLLAVLNMPLMVVFSIVSRGAVASVWPDKALARGNAVLEITLQSGAMCAALLTGGLYGKFGFSFLIALGGVLTLAAGLLLVFSPLRFDGRTDRDEKYWVGLRKGFTYLRAHPAVFLYGLCAFVPTVVISASNTVIPGYVEQTLGKGAFVYGVGDICFALGALFAGWWGSRRTGKNTHGYFLGRFAVSVGCLLALMVFTRLWAFYAAVFLVGIFLAQLRIGLNTVFMQVADVDFLGRSLSLLMAISMGMQALLAYGAGVVMDAWGAPSGFALLSAALLCGPLLLLFVRQKN